MPARSPTAAKTVDGILKSVLVLARTAEHVLEEHAVERAIEQPLSPSKIQILRLLGQRGPQNSSQVARFLGVSKPAVTQIIEAMVTAKLVTRKSTAADRREVQLALSTKGRDMFQALRRAQRHAIRAALRDVSPGDVERWIATLREVSGAIARADDAYEHFCAQCGAHEDGSCVLVGGDADCLFLEYTGQRSRRRRLASAKT